ncbi:hypothetical protein F5B21DRAFT_525028 [Xylaria acuta]|nr:hypothetical protein F5B21DRAFT_525028 [Xylaria acuta]
MTQVLQNVCIGFAEMLDEFKTSLVALFSPASEHGSAYSTTRFLKSLLRQLVDQSIGNTNLLSVIDDLSKRSERESASRTEDLFWELLTTQCSKATGNINYCFERQWTFILEAELILRLLESKHDHAHMPVIIRKTPQTVQGILDHMLPKIDHKNLEM